MLLLTVVAAILPCPDTSRAVSPSTRETQDTLEFLRPTATDDPAARAWQTSLQSPLCGIWCVYAAALFADSPVEPRALHRAEFVSQFMGSTFIDVEEAATAAGLSAWSFGNMSVPDLIAGLPATSASVILHVRHRPDMELADHFVLVRALEHGKFAWFDPPTGLRVIDEAELADALAWRWSGNGLLIADDRAEGAGTLDTARGTLLFPGRLRLAAWLAMIFAACLAAHAIKTGRAERAPPRILLNPVIQAVILAGVGVAGAAAFHTVSRVGFASTPRAVAAIEEWHTDAFLDRAYFADVDRAVQTGDAVVVDSRSLSQFEEDHIPTARLLPFLEVMAGRPAVLEGVPLDRKIIVYCVDENCGVSVRVAQAMKRQGYTNVSVYDGGIVEWDQKADEPNAGEKGSDDVPN